MEEYRKDSPAWDVIIDLDALAEAEGENWVWKSAQVLRPSFDRALISLSRGGADASVIREYSLTSRSFVAPDEGGFVVPEAKTDIDWIDADTVFVGTDLGPGSLTDSGYPRRAHRWLRGTPLAEAPVVYEGEQTDVAVSASHDATPGFERSLVQRATDFFNAVTSILHEDGSTTILDVPTDASVSLHENWLTVRLTTAWTVDGTEYAAGSLVAAKIDEFLSGARDLVVVFAPDARTSLHQYAWTENHLLMVLLEDVRSSVHVVTLGDTVTSERLQGLPDAVDVTVIGTDPEFGGDEYFLDASGHLTPSTLLVGTVGTEPEVLKSAPAFFDTTGLAVEQYFATSLDGTRVPYFVVRNPGTQDRPTAAGPTLLYGYGGFEVSLTPRTAAWSARPGWLGAVPTWWRTSAAAASTGRRGTPRC